MFKQSEALSFKTYDCKPMEDVGYPFVEFEDTQNLFSQNKSAVLGNVVLTLSVWGLQKKRQEVSNMASQLFQRALSINVSDNYKWHLDVNSSAIQTMEDTTTNDRLQRAVIELNFELIGG